MSDEKELTEEELEKAAGGLRASKTNKPLGEASGSASSAPETQSGTGGGATGLPDPPFGTGQ